MLVVSVLSLKGGVGKTSVVLGLAGAALKKCLSTVVIDLDPQGNATSVLRSRRIRGTATTVLAHPTGESIREALTRSDWKGGGDIRLIASDPNLVRFDAWSGTHAFRPKLARAVKHLDVDLVLIDCPPSLGALTREALAAADLAVVVTTPSYFGAQGAERAIAEIRVIRDSVNPRLEFAGIVVNRLREKTEEHRYRKRELIQIHGAQAVLKPYIPERVAVQQAESAGQPLQAVKSQGAREVSKAFDKMLGRLIKFGKDRETAQSQ
ncbi:MAG: ParA family protein [Actinobacteria bacterium]|nr:ParA family protein [Actinomycetota bacterium]